MRLDDLAPGGYSALLAATILAAASRARYESVSTSREPAAVRLMWSEVVTLGRWLDWRYTSHQADPYIGGLLILETTTAVELADRIMYRERV